MNSKSEKYAIFWQKNIRKFNAQNKYKINRLADKDMKSYKTFVVGNDPSMKCLDSYKENEKFALIGTSGLRSISLACKIGDKNIIPKIFIIDNSYQVMEFWYKFREIAYDKDKKSEENFIDSVMEFLEDNSDLYRNITAFNYEGKNPEVKYLNPNPLTFINGLIKLYGHDRIIKVISNVSLINQSWEDPLVLVKIKNILNYTQIYNIYVYPSNIVHCVNKNTQKNILNNIDKISPKLSIHTDRCEEHGIPENVFCFENNNSTFVQNSLFSKTTCKPQSLSDISERKNETYTF